MDVNLAIFLFTLPVIFGLAVVSYFWRRDRSKKILQRRAFQNGLKLTDVKYCWYARGPFWWRTSEGQTVYRIEVVDSQGQYQWGWARCGSWFWGLFTDRVTVEWVKSQPEKAPPGFPVVMNPKDEHVQSH